MMGVSAAHDRRRRAVGSGRGARAYRARPRCRPDPRPALDQSPQPAPRTDGARAPHSHDEVEAAISRLNDRQESLFRNRQVTLATEAYLTAVATPVSKLIPEEAAAVRSFHDDSGAVALLGSASAPLEPTANLNSLGDELGTELRVGGKRVTDPANNVTNDPELPTTTDVVASPGRPEVLGVGIQSLGLGARALLRARGRALRVDGRREGRLERCAQCRLLVRHRCLCAAECGILRAPVHTNSAAPSPPETARSKSEFAAARDRGSPSAQ